MKNEGKFGKSLAVACRLKKVNILRIEAFQSGIPDYYAIPPKGAPFWIETKYISFVDSASIPKDWIRPAQLQFFSLFHAQCPESYIVVKAVHLMETPKGEEETLDYLAISTYGQLGGIRKVKNKHELFKLADCVTPDIFQLVDFLLDPSEGVAM